LRAATQVLYDKILDAAVAIMHLDMASMQALDEEEDALRLLAWRGFDSAFGQIVNLLSPLAEDLPQIQWDPVSGLHESADGKRRAVFEAPHAAKNIASRTSAMKPTLAVTPIAPVEMPASTASARLPFAFMTCPPSVGFVHTPTE
jgi:hypothetical protein